MSKLIFFTALFYIVFKFISKVINFNNINSVKKTAKNQKNNPRQEGDVSIDKIPKNIKNSDKKIGDYVDYEEID